MATAAVPPVTDIPPFPALSDRTEGNYNAMAYAFGSHMSTKFKPELIAVAANVLQNANEAVAKAAVASEAAAVASAAVSATRDAAADAASALASKQAAALSASAAAQSATSAQQAKQSVEQSLASVAGGPVISINDQTGVVKIKVPTTGDVVVSARGDYSVPDYLPCDGGLYLRSAYSKLAAMIPVEYPATKMTVVTPPSAVAFSVAISRDSTYMAVGISGANGLNVYKRNSDTQFLPLNLTGTFTNTGQAVDFSADGTYLAVGGASNDSSVLAVFKRSGDVFTKLSSPSVQPTSTVYSVAFSPNGTFLAVGTQGNGERLAIYSRGGDVFAKITAPAVMPTGNVNGLSFSPDSTYLAVGDTSYNLLIYKRSGQTFTKLADPDVLPNGIIDSVVFSADGNYLAVANRGTNKILIYQRDGDTFTLVATPVAATGSQIVSCVAFSPNGNYLAVSISNVTTPAIFRKVGNAFTKMPSLDVGLITNSVAFSGDSLTLAFAANSSPYIIPFRVGYNTNTQFKLPTQNVDGLGLLGYIKT